MSHTQANVYSSLAEGESVLRGIDLSDPVRARAGTLATFLSRTEFDLRALRRRLAVEDLFDAEEVRELVVTALLLAPTIVIGVGEAVVGGLRGVHLEGGQLAGRPAGVRREREP